MGKDKNKRPILLFFTLYIFTVLWYTVLRRPSSFAIPQFELFWSYKRWFDGDEKLGRQILANIAMFIPFGFFLSSLKVRGSITFLCAVLFSLLIETLQLTLMRGTFEWDDLMNNTLGAMIGWGLCWVVIKWGIPALPFALVFMAVCWGMLFTTPDEEEIQNIPRYYCFQIDKAKMEGNQLTLTGFVLRYGHNKSEPQIILSARNKSVTFETTFYNRPDIENYFDEQCTGFTAVGNVDEEAEYEIEVRFPLRIPIPTGVYITGADIHYFPEASFTAPNLNAPFISEGVPLVYRPDEHCWVYQYQGDLYWIADDGFLFEDDGITYIQYQLWTTQIDKLPKKRLENNWYWDNIGGYFEKYELEGDFGSYRVMKREIPKQYAVTSIVTGYYKDGKWLWKEYFRPHYNEFLMAQ